MEFKNFTPHTVRILTDDGEYLTIPSEGSVRVKGITKILPSVFGVNFVKKSYSGVEGLPEPQKGVIYIVSVVVINAITDRDDIACPNTGPDSVIRDENGQIFGVKRLQVRGGE